MSFLLPGQLLATQTAVAAVLNAASISSSQPSQTFTSDNMQVSFAKREEVGLDLASLVKDAVFDSQQVILQGPLFAKLLPISIS